MKCSEKEFSEKRVEKLCFPCSGQVSVDAFNTLVPMVLHVVGLEAGSIGETDGGICKDDAPELVVRGILEAQIMAELEIRIWDTS